MKKSLLILAAAAIGLTALVPSRLAMNLRRETTVDSLGACQGISYQAGRIFLYGDRECGVVREYRWEHDSLVDLQREYRLTENGRDVINHPTGIAFNGTGPTFIGNSIRLNREGTKWKAVIYCVDWKGLLKSGTLDGNILNMIEDDACIQGTRPEYVKYHNKWYVATADYGDKGNEVRLYDPEKLKTCKRTSDAGVLFKEFTCSPWVQNLHWIPKKDILVLVQNQLEGRKWRLTFVRFSKSLEEGKMKVIKQIDFDSRPDELEGFSFVGDQRQAIAVTSSRMNNVNYVEVTW